MDEINFRQKLVDWRMTVRTAIVPTTACVRLYGQTDKTSIIPSKHEHLIYTCLKTLEISDELYKKLSNEMKLSDDKVLKFVHKTYEQYLKDIRRNIIKLQKQWSKNYAHFRAKQVITKLKYENIYHICDLSNERIVPIELILKVLFDITSTYGEHRRIKDKEEIYMDPRVLQLYNNRKDEERKHKEYIRKYELNKLKTT